MRSMGYLCMQKTEYQEIKKMKDIFLYIIFGIECFLGGVSVVSIVGLMIITLIKKLYRKIVYKASMYD